MEKMGKNELFFILDTFIKEGDQTTLGEIGGKFRMSHGEVLAYFDEKHPDLKRTQIK